MQSVNTELSRLGYLIDIRISEEVRNRIKVEVWNEVWDCVDCQVWLLVKRQFSAQVRDQIIAERSNL
jgi:hypothetical protein